MKSEVRFERQLTITRDEKDTSVKIVTDLSDRPSSPAEFWARRSEYNLAFDTPEEAQKALAKVIKIGDFDKAAAWMDKQ